MHGRRSLALAVAALTFAVVPSAQAKPQPKVAFKLALPKAGATSVRVIGVKLVKHDGARAAARKLDLRIALKGRTGLPDDLLVSGEVLRGKAGRATIVIAAFRPQTSTGRAHAAQDQTIQGSARISAFDLGIYTGGAWTTDWYSDEIDLPDRCLIGSGTPDDAFHAFIGSDFPQPPQVQGLFEEFVRAACARGPHGRIVDFMHTATLPPPIVPNISMTSFGANPFEASIVVSYGGVFTAIKVEATGANSFSQCYNGGAPCDVHDAGAPGNDVVFPFPGGSSETAELNVRSGNTEFPAWGRTNFYVLQPGETIFDGPFPRTP